MLAQIYSLYFLLKKNNKIVNYNLSYWILKGSSDFFLYLYIIEKERKKIFSENDIYSASRLRVACGATDGQVLGGGLLQQDPQDYCQGAQVRSCLGIQVNRIGVFKVPLPPPLPFFFVGVRVY